MPCDTRREVTVELKVADEKILIDGLFAAGFNVNSIAGGLYVNKGRRRGELKNGKITVLEGDESIVNEIKRAYSGEVVRQSAKRFGWTLNATTEQNVVVAKRRF